MMIKIRRMLASVVFFMIIFILWYNKRRAAFQQTQPYKQSGLSLRAIEEKLNASFAEGKQQFPEMGEEKILKIAIGVAITSKGAEDVTEPNLPYKFPFFQALLSSFCKTSTQGYYYIFYVAYDDNDPFFTNNTKRQWFVDTFFKIKQTTCNFVTQLDLKLVKCDHFHHPAWAQNDAMMAAYLDHCDYYYRMNDDTLMKTPGWTDKFLQVLQQNQPSNVGVVGPFHYSGNRAIMTYDFVHRTHIDIFGFYYPRTFTDWFADDWINNVYSPNYIMMLHEVKVLHTQMLGTRYDNQFGNVLFMKDQIARDKLILHSYISYVNKTLEQKQKVFLDEGIIAMALDDSSNSQIYGILRNVHLAKLYYPGWKLVVTSYNKLTDQIRRKLKAVGIKVQEQKYDWLPKCLSHYGLLASSQNRSVLLRNPSHRLSSRDAQAVLLWKSAQTHGVLSVMDHPDHLQCLLNPGLVGISKNFDRRRLLLVLEDFVQKKNKENGNKFKDSDCAGAEFEKEFLCYFAGNHLDVKDLTIYQGVNCKVLSKHPGATLQDLPHRSTEEFCGQNFDVNEVPLDDSTTKVIEWLKQPSC